MGSGFFIYNVILIFPSLIDILYSVYRYGVARLTEVKALRYVEYGLLAIRQCRVGINLLHEISPYWQSHRSTLPEATGIEMDVAVLTTNPATTDKLRCEAHKPTVGVVVRRSGLSAYIAIDVVAVDTTSGTSVDDGPQHVYHLVGVIFTDNLIHQRLELCYDVAVAVLDTCNEHWRTAYAMIGESRICTYHLTHRHLTRSKAEYRRGILVYIRVVKSEVMKDVDELRWSELRDECRRNPVVGVLKSP